VSCGTIASEVRAVLDHILKFIQELKEGGAEVVIQCEP
jgi:hypothetical protein